MLQVVQYQKTGEIKIEEMPTPICPDQGILVETSFSVISSGTERTSVTNSQGSLITRAKKQPENVKLVLDTVKKFGVKETVRRVNAKLDSFKVLGYSASGIVIESKCDEFKPGDKVAVGGAGYANHSEIVAIPKNLATLVPKNVSMQDASYTTVGSIAMQGFRQAEPELGENIAVIGLGLLGQITIQLLKAAGCNVIAMDINEDLFEDALNFGADSVVKSSKDNISKAIAFAEGMGVDSTIITASTSSSEPLQLAMEITRKKGKVVIVGAIGMELQRNPFYKKEIDLRISSSYGPGRYEPFYEEKGLDYPYAFVRWTENRNFKSFLNLIRDNKIDLKSLTSHNFKINDASKAYDIITGKTPEKHLGILLEYPKKENKQKKYVLENNKTLEDIRIGFIGAGQFAQNYLLPTLKSQKISLHSVANASAASSKAVAKHFGFNFSVSSADDIIENNEINTVFIATRHNTHGNYVLDALKNKKNVFVEKPLSLSSEDLNKIFKLASENSLNLMVGYNRRFSPIFKEIKKFFQFRQEPLIVKYRVNGGQIPKSNWVQTAEGGGRILGEACHFIDTMQFLIGANPERVFAESISSGNESIMNNDNFVATLKFSDGSIGILEYFSNGDGVAGKEYCEVYAEKSVAIMNDFKELTLAKGGRKNIKKYNGEKGHREEMREFIISLSKGKSLISLDSILNTSKVTFAIIESLEKAIPIKIS